MAPNLLNEHDASDIDELNAKGIACPDVYLHRKNSAASGMKYQPPIAQAFWCNSRTLLLQSRYCGYALLLHRPSPQSMARRTAERAKFKIVFNPTAAAGAVRIRRPWSPQHRRIRALPHGLSSLEWPARRSHATWPKSPKHNRSGILPPPQTAPLILGEPSAEPIPTHPEVSAGFTNIINETAESRDPARHDALFAEWFAQDPARWQRDQSTKTATAPASYRPRMAAWDNEHYGTNRDPNDLVGAANAKLIEWRLRIAPTWKPAPTAQAMAEL